MNLCLRPAWFTLRVSGQLGLYGETWSQQNKRTEDKKNWGGYAKLEPPYIFGKNDTTALEK